jgi:excisionase family DNA binding protein
MKPLVSLPRPALRKAQVARILGVCEPIVYRLIREGRLRAFRPTPSSIRILPSDLEDFIAAHATIPSGPFVTL